MPGISPEQRHTAHMALAHKRGKPLSAFPEGARNAIAQMAEMSEGQLEDFMRPPGRRRGTILTGRR